MMICSSFRGQSLVAMTVLAVGLSLTPGVGRGLSATVQDPYLDKIMRCDEIKKRSKRQKCIAEVLAALRAEQRAPAPADSSTRRDPPAVHSRDSAGGQGTVGGQDSAGKRDFSDRPESPEKGFRARLVRYKKDAIGRHYFLLDNGQVWREKKSSSLSRINPRTDYVRIKKGLISGWRITFDRDNQLGIVELVR